MSRLTLRDRVTVTSVLVLALGIGAIGLLFNVLLAHRLDADASAVLRSRAAAQRATLDLSRGGLRTVEGPSDEALDRDLHQPSWDGPATRLTRSRRPTRKPRDVQCRT